MDNYPQKRKNPESQDESSPYMMFYWRLFLALIIPATILAGLLLLPVLFINKVLG